MGEHEYVYIQSEPNLWTVGFYDSMGNWHPESDFGDQGDAAARVHYLNGGAEDINTDMLEACEALLEMWDDVADKIDWGSAFFDVSTIAKMNTAPGKAEAAIARARGES
jgi:hypothetical protein